MSRWLPSVLASTLALGWACSSRPVDEETGAGSVDDTSDDAMTGTPEAGVQPTEAGAMYSPCERSAQCPPQEFCVFPAGESGYCTSACNAPADPSNCDPAPGDQPQTCFDIGLEDGRWVCALDCASTPCPSGMRCEEIGTTEGARSICF